LKQCTYAAKRQRKDPRHKYEVAGESQAPWKYDIHP
jgi:hypothetical protein